MPAYHSSWKDYSAAGFCSASLLPLKINMKGPAPILSDPNVVDIIDEAILFFRANILFRSFEVEGGADRVLCYLTVYISDCLRQVSKFTDKLSAQKHLFAFSKTEFAIPGESGFTLGGFFTQPQSKAEGDAFRAYFKQLREECAARIIHRIYNDDGNANKFWMAFSKRQFMNIKCC